MKQTKSDYRPEYQSICSLVPEGTSVLDMGCGRGELLSLMAARGARGQGIEINREAIAECVRRGVSVLFGDLDKGLNEYPDKIFDFVILNNCLPETRHPQIVLKEALRVGKKVVAGFPNFCHYRIRMQVFFRGVTPVTDNFPYPWYDGPNLRFLSTRDFISFCRQNNITIHKAFHFSGRRTVKSFPNLLADYSVFLLEEER